MMIEQWLRQNVAKDHFPSKRYAGISIFLLIVSVIILNGPYGRTIQAIRELTATWASSSPQDRGIFLFMAFAVLICFIGILWFLDLLPRAFSHAVIVSGGGWRDQLTGRQRRLLSREERRLQKKLKTIYKSVPRPINFSDADYTNAAEKLKNFHGMRMTELETFATEPWLQILVMSGAIGAVRGSVVRLVDLDLVEKGIA